MRGWRSRGEEGRVPLLHRPGSSSPERAGGPREAGLRRTGFNLIEVLITLTMVALLTTTLISFVNDYDDKARLAKAKNDLARLAQMAMLAESRSGKPLVMTTASVTGSLVPTQMADTILDLPSHDPWGNRYVVSANGTVTSSSTEGAPYVVDAGFGRIICAGPDGVVNTRIGSGISDTDNDLVVEFRQLPWLAWAGEFGGRGEILLARADGTRVSTVEVDVINVCFSPDGSRWVGVRSASLIYGNTSAENPATQVVPLAPVFPVGATDYAVDDGTYPFFFPDGQHIGWVNTDGSFRVFDMFSAQHRRVIDPGTFIPDTSTMSDNLGRIVHVSTERSYYWRKLNNAVNSIAIAVSPDGKIAYGKYTSPNTLTDGIWVALPDGSGRRMIKHGGDPPPPESPPKHSDREWLPLFWADASVLVYYGLNSDAKLAFGRVAQDGRFDIPLYPCIPGPFDEAVGPKEPLMPSISPDGTTIHFTHADDGTSKVVKIDGTGWLKSTKVLSSFLITDPPNRFQEAIFAPDGSGYYLAREAPTTNGIGKLEYRLENPALPPVFESPGANTSFDVVPGAMSLSSDGTLMAVISSPVAAGGRKGVFVFPIQGPDGASLQVDPRTPAASSSEFARITWLRN